MERKPLVLNAGQPTDEEQQQLEKIIELVHSGKYFKRITQSLLKLIFLQGELLNLSENEYLIHEGDNSPPEMYVLIKGSLVVQSGTKFILRLELAGDVAGEMSVISPAPRSADVIAETDCVLVAFSQQVFAVQEEDAMVPVFYVMFAYILAEKLRLTTAQSFIRKNSRVDATQPPKVAVIDTDSIERLMIRNMVEFQWPEAEIEEFADPMNFIALGVEKHFDVIIVDVLFPHTYRTQEESIKSLIHVAKTSSTSVIVMSEYCADAMNRGELIHLGLDSLIAKPYSLLDFKHILLKSRLWYYQQKELDDVEHTANTDKLTGLANRQRFDEFMSALMTISRDNKQKFSLIIADIDHFKHYNDTHGHQMGDVVLATVAGIFSNNVRRGDLAVRFGGEEFVIVLVNCNKQTAIQIAEKLRVAITDQDFPHQEEQPLGNLTCTFGVGTYPDDAEDITNLIEKSDQCLYIGKKSGRNKVIAVNTEENTD